MKRLAIVFVIILPVLAFSQRKPKIKGNRSVTEVSETLPPFNAIELKDDLEIGLRKSFGEGYRIVADDNLVDVLKFEVVDGTLIISSYYDIVSKKKLEIIVEFVELNAITLQTGKLIGMDTISAETFYANTFGNSDLDVAIDAFVVSLTAEDNSRTAMKLDVDSLNIIQRHRSNAEIYSVSGTNQIELYDNGDLTLEGTTEEMSATLMGNTKMKAQKQQAATVKLMADENSMVRVQATKMLQLSAMGDSKIYLYGNPQITINAFMDTPQLIKKELNSQ